MNNYAIAQNVVPTAFNGSGLGFSSPRSQVRTPPPQNPRSPAQRAHTQFTILKEYGTNFFEHSAGTGTATAPVVAGIRNAAETTSTIINEPARTAPAEVECSLRSDIDQIARERMVLLARKYADQHSPETLARLEKLNGLLLEVAPRVSDEQIVALRNSRALLQRTDAARVERARRRAEQAQI